MNYGAACRYRHNENDPCPKTAKGRDGSDKQSNTQQGFQDTPPFRLVIFEVTEKNMTYENQEQEYCYVEPHRACFPHRGTLA